MDGDNSWPFQKGCCAVPGTQRAHGGRWPVIPGVGNGKSWCREHGLDQASILPTWMSLSLLECGRRLGNMNDRGACCRPLPVLMQGWHPFMPQSQSYSAPAGGPRGLFLLSSAESEPAAWGRREVGSGGERQRRRNGPALGSWKPVVSPVPWRTQQSYFKFKKGTSRWGLNRPEEIHCLSAEPMGKGRN